MMKPLKVIGFWQDGFLARNPNPCILPIENTIDPRVVDYIKSGHEYSLSPGFSYCRFKCGISDYGMGNRELFDGTYIWPDGLAHYLEEHKIQLPQYFLDHIAFNQFKVPHVEVADFHFSNVVLQEDEWLEWGKQFLPVKSSLELKSEEDYLKSFYLEDLEFAKSIFDSVVGDNETKLKKVTEAIEYLKESASEDYEYVPAMFLLGVIYSNPYEGWSLEKNYEEAVKWFKMAAENGHKQAQRSLDEIL